MRFPTWFAGVVAVGLAISALTGCSSATAAKSTTNSATGEWSFVAPGGAKEITYPAAERRPVANFAGQLVSGGNTQLSDYPGVVVINVWGQWCGPCRTEVDDMEEVYHQIQPRGGTVLGIDVRDNDLPTVQDFMQDNGLTYPSVYDPPFKTAAALGGVPAAVVPTTIVLDKQHRPAAVFLRAVTAPELLQVVNPLLEES